MGRRYRIVFWRGEGEDRYGACLFLGRFRSNADAVAKARKWSHDNGNDEWAVSLEGLSVIYDNTRR